VYVLNFYSPVFVDQLKRGRKTATIRLGDKSSKYKKGQVVLITVGFQHSPRERIFEAVPARHRARQPRVPPSRGDHALPRADLRQARGEGRRGDDRPLQRDHGPAF
jgi:hypothetical protein